MKKLAIVAIVALGFIACGEDKAKTSPESAPVTPGIENTDGNLPDSSNSIPLNSTLPVDSSRLKDSVPR